MNEKEFGKNIQPWLERSAAAVGEMQATRLRSARLQALDAYREPVQMFGFLAVGQGTVQTIKYSILQQALLWLPLIILLAMLTMRVLYPEMDIGELDALLLTGELPIDAFLDEDFDHWLKSASGSF